jgi:hypothetical protein
VCGTVCHQGAWPLRGFRPPKVIIGDTLCGGAAPSLSALSIARAVASAKDPASVLRTGFSKVKSNKDVSTMASEESAKRFLRLVGYWPKNTRAPRGPEHMAKMKAARAPYTDPRDTYIASRIRWAFERSKGKPLTTGQLVKEVYGLQLLLERKPPKSWQYQNVRRALRKVATPIGRASTRGRPVLWRPDERMGLRDRARRK